MEYFIIDRMYAGDFLRDNIGHEVTNLFRDDDGNAYVYVNKSGDVKADAQDATHAVLYTRTANNIHRQEVLGIAIIERGVHDFDYDSISYGGVTLREIFAENIFKGINDGYVNLNFKAKKVLLPPKEKKIYIADDVYDGDMENTIRLSDIRFPNQSLRRYIDSTTDSFRIIESMINDSGNWDNDRKLEQIDLKKNDLLADDTFNYLDIIGQRDDENVFSNLIEHFLKKDSKLFFDFCKKFNIEHHEGEKYTIEREKYADGPRMDIFIENENCAVVIENKIKSNINGVNERHNFSGNLVQSQLADYYKYIEKNYSKKKTRKYFILMPNYHDIDIKKYEHSEKYIKILYSDIYDFFKSHTIENKKEIGYYNDFIKALSRHKELYYDDQFAEMKRRFVERLENCISK